MSPSPSRTWPLSRTWATLTPATSRTWPPFERACRKIADGAGSQFDPAVVATFAAIAPGLPDLHASLHGEVGQGGPLARAGMPD